MFPRAITNWVRTIVTRADRKAEETRGRSRLRMEGLEDRTMPTGSGLDDLRLVTDDGPAVDDFFTTDPHLRGSLTGGSAAAGRAVGFDYNGDGYTDATAIADASGTVQVFAAGLSSGYNSVRARVLDGDTGRDWLPLTFHFLAPGTALPQVGTLGLANDTGASPTDRSTADGTVAGILVGAGAGGTTVEFDWTGDGEPDGSAVANTAGAFSITPANLPEGLVNVRARVVGTDPGGQPITGTWSGFGFNLSATPDAAAEQARATALAVLGSVGRAPGSAAERDVVSAAAETTRRLFQQSQQALGAARQLDEAARATALQTFNTLRAAADNGFDTRNQAADAQFAADLAAFNGQTETFPVRELAWPGSPDLSGVGPQLPGDGDLPTLPTDLQEGAAFDPAANNLFQQLQTQATGVRTTDRTAATAAHHRRTADMNPANLSAKYVYEQRVAELLGIRNAAVAAADQQYYAATNSGSVFFAQQREGEEARRLARQAAVSAANAERDAELARLAGIRTQALAAADQLRQSKDATAQTQYQNTVNQANAAREAEIAAAWAEYNASQNQGGSNPPPSGPSPPPGGPEGGGEGGPISQNPPSNAAWDRLQARLAAAEDLYRTTVAHAAKTLALALAANQKEASLTENAAEEAYAHGAADAEKIRVQKVNEAWRTFRLGTATDESSAAEYKFAAQTAAEFAKATARAAYARGLADAIQVRDDAIAAADRDLAAREAEIDEAFDRAIADARVSGVTGWAGAAPNGWQTFQIALYTNARTNTNAVATANRVFSVARADQELAIARAVNAAARAAEYDRVAADVIEVETRITATTSFNTLATTEKKNYTLLEYAGLQDLSDRRAAIDREYVRGEATTGRTVRDSEAAALEEYMTRVADANLAYALNQNQAQLNAALAAASTAYQQRLTTLRVQAGTEVVQLDFTHKMSRDEALAIRELASHNNENGLRNLLEQAARLLDATLASAVAARDVAHTAADNRVPVAAAEAGQTAAGILHQAYRGLRTTESQADAAHQIGDAQASATFETGLAERQATAFVNWVSAAASPTRWMIHQRDLALAHRDFVVASLTAAVAKTEATVNAGLAQLSPSFEADRVKMEAETAAQAVAARAVAAAKVAAAQSAGAIEVTAGVRASAARRAYERTTAEAEKEYKNKDTEAKKRLQDVYNRTARDYFLSSPSGLAAIGGGLAFGPLGGLYGYGIGSFVEEQTGAGAAARAARDAERLQAEGVAVIDRLQARRNLAVAVAGAKLTYAQDLAAATRIIAPMVRSAAEAAATAQADIKKGLDEAVAAAARGLAEAAADVAGDLADATDMAAKNYAVALAVAAKANDERLAGLTTDYAKGRQLDHATAVEAWAAANPSPANALAARRARTQATLSVAVAAADRRELERLAQARYDETIGKAYAAALAALAKSFVQRSSDVTAAGAAEAGAKALIAAMATAYKAEATADAGRRETVTLRQADYDGATAQATHAYEVQVADAQLNYGSRVASAKKLHHNSTDPNAPALLAAAIEAARKDLYNPAVSPSIGSAIIARAEGRAAARTAWISAARAADDAFAQAVAAARTAADTQVAAARAQIVTDEQAALAAWNTQATTADETAAAAIANKAIARVEAEASAAVDHATDLDGPLATAFRAMADAEADYHIAVADAELAAKQAAHAAAPTRATFLTMREAQLWRDWLQAVKPGYLQYQEDVARRQAQSEAEMARAGTDQLREDARGARLVAEAETGADKTFGTEAATRRQASETGAAARTRAHETASVTAANTREVDLAAAQGAKTVALAVAEAAYSVESMRAFAAWQSDTLTWEGSQAYQARLAAAEAARRTAVAAAEKTYAYAAAAAEAKYDRALAAATKALELGDAAAAEQDAKAAADKAAARDRTVLTASVDAIRIGVEANAAYQLAAAKERQKLERDMAGYDWDYFTAQATAAVPAFNTLAGELGTPYAQFLADKAQAEAAWYAGQRAAYVAATEVQFQPFVTAAEAVDQRYRGAYVQAVMAAHRTEGEARIDREAAGGRAAADAAKTLADAVTNAAAAYDEATIAATEAHRKALADAAFNQGQQLPPGMPPPGMPLPGGPGVGSNDYLAAVLAARLAYVQAEAAAQKTHDTALAARGRQDAEADAWGQYQLASDVAAADRAMQVFAADQQRDADLLAAQLFQQKQTVLLDTENAAVQQFAAAHPSPWATRWAARTAAEILRQKDLLAATRAQDQAGAAAAHAAALAAADAERDQTGAGALAALWDQYAAARTEEKQILDASTAARTAALAQFVMGWVFAPLDWVAHLYDERSALTLLAGAGPKDNPRIPDAFTRFGLHGERWADAIVAGMFTTTTWYSPEHWGNWFNEMWNESVAAGYGNPLEQFIAERARGWLGDEFIGSHSTLENIGALWLAGNVKANEWVSNGLIDFRASTVELLARKLHIWGLYAEGDWDLALRQDAAFTLGLLGESSVVTELMSGGPLGSLVRYGLSGLFDVQIAGPEAMQQEMLKFGRMLHLGAANSGQQSALAVDAVYRAAEVAVQIAADVAISVVTAGAATPVVAAKWAATAAAWAARAAAVATRVVRVAVTAAKFVGRAVVELASATVKLGRWGWQMLKAGATKVVEYAGALLSKAKNFVAEIPSLINAAATKAVQVARAGMETLGRIRDKLNPLVSTVVHGWAGRGSLHTTLSKFANRLGFRTCFVAGTPIRTPSGSKPIEEFRSYEEVGDACDYVLARSESDPTGPVRPRRVLRKFVRVGPVLNLHLGGRVIGTTAEHPFYAEGRGWTPAYDLRIGDRLILESGECLPVEGVADSGRVETVYNMEVEDDHTYFVGDTSWGWAVWSHNTVYEWVAKGMKLLKGNPFVQEVLDAIKTAAGQARTYVDNLTHLSGPTGSRRIDLYINLLKAKAGTPLSELPPSVRELVEKFTKNGVTNWDGLLRIFRGSAIQARTDDLLRGQANIVKLLADKKLFFNEGSKLGLVSKKGNLLRPDYQLKLADDKWAVLDLTTHAEKGKILKKYNHRRTPFLIELLH
jgi:hypothetical protein